MTDTKAKTKDEGDDERKEQKNLTAEYLADPKARNMAVEGNDLSGFIGVSPEYMHYADETQKPFSTDEEVVPTTERLDYLSEPEESKVDSKDVAPPAPAKAAAVKPPTPAKAGSANK